MTGDSIDERRRAAGWHDDGPGGSRGFFDGHGWVVLESVSGGASNERRFPIAVVPVTLGVLAVSLMVSRVLADRFSAGVWVVPISVAVSYGPTAAWVVFVHRRWSGVIAGAARWSARRIDLLWGPVTWIGIVALQVVTIAILVLVGVPIAGNVDAVSGGGIDLWVAVMLTFVAVVLAPLVEETAFRGVVLAGLLPRTGASVAVIVQATAFGFAHLDPSRGWGTLGTVVVLIGVGLGLGIAATATGRIATPVIAHALFNAVALAVAWSGIADRVDVDLFGA